MPPQPGDKTEGLPEGYDPSQSEIFEVGKFYEQYRACQIEKISEDGAHITVKPVDKPESVLSLGSRILSDDRVRELGNQKPWEAGEYITVVFHKSRNCGHGKKTVCGDVEVFHWERGFKMSP